MATKNSASKKKGYTALKTTFHKWSKKGEEFEGKIIDFKNTTYGKAILLETEKGQRIMVGMNPVLEGQITEDMKGRTILIEYLGTVKSPSYPSPYNNFVVYVKDVTPSK